MLTANSLVEELSMLKSPFLAAALFAATLCVPGVAQDAKKDTPIKPPDSPSKVVLDSWNDVGRKLIAMAEDSPKTNTISNPRPPSAASPTNFSTPPEPTTTSPIR